MYFRIKYGADKYGQEIWLNIGRKENEVTKTPELPGHLILGKRMKPELYTRKRLKELAVENIRFIRELFFGDFSSGHRKYGRQSFCLR